MKVESSGPVYEPDKTQATSSEFDDLVGPGQNRVAEEKSAAETSGVEAIPPAVNLGNSASGSSASGSSASGNSAYGSSADGNRANDEDSIINNGGSLFDADSVDALQKQDSRVKQVALDLGDSRMPAFGRGAFGNGITHTNQSIIDSSFTRSEFDSIFGDIVLSPLENAIINHPQFQRLKYVRQHSVSRSEHGSQMSFSRYEHSIGVMHVSGKISDALNLTLEEKSYVRVMGLLHDFAHLPFSHVLQPFAQKHCNFDHDSNFGPRLKEAGLDIVIQAHGLDPQVVIDGLKNAKDVDNYMGRISKMWADRIDYTVRDYWHSGVAKWVKEEIQHLTDDLIHCLRLEDRRLEIDDQGHQEYKGKLCIPFHRKPFAEKFARFRTHMFTSLSVHPLAIVFNKQLEQAVHSAGSKDPNFYKRMIAMNDDELISALPNENQQRLRKYVEDAYDPLIAFSMDDLNAAGHTLVGNSGFDRAVSKVLSGIMSEGDFIAGSTPLMESKPIKLGVAYPNRQDGTIEVRDESFGPPIDTRDGFVFVFVSKAHAPMHGILAERLNEELMYKILKDDARLDERVTGIVHHMLYSQRMIRKHTQQQLRNTGSVFAEDVRNLYW